MIPVKQQAQVCLRPDGHVCVFRRRRFTVSNGNKRGIYSLTVKFAVRLFVYYCMQKGCR